MQLRFAGRLFVKSPLFTAIVVITMAIAIGLNTTVFAAVESLLLRPLPGTTAPDQLVQLYRTGPGMPWGSNSVPHYIDVRERTGDVFESVAAWTYAYYSMSTGDRPRRLMGQLVSANYFTTLGVRPALGRFFLPAEDSTRGAHPVVVLGHSTWRGMLGGDPGVIGRNILLNGQSMQVVGVAPAEFRGAMPILDPVAWVPLMQMGQMQPERAGAFESRGNNFMNVVARLRDGASLEQAGARLSLVNEQLAAVYPEPYRDRGTWIVRQADAGIHPSMRSAQVGLSAVILAVVGLLLLIACVNISNLFLARAHDRGKEMAVRLALGASRGQLLRQLLSESLVFALAAGVAGILVAMAGIALANRISLPLDIGFRPDLSLNPRVLLFTLGVTLLAGLLFGIAPAFQATRPSLIPGLKGEAPAGSGRSRVRHGLIVAQMALSIILLTCAGLFLSNLRTATTLDVGFTPAGAVTASLAPGLQGYDRPKTEQFYRSLFERLRATPGVDEVGIAETLPLSIGGSDTRVEIPGYAPAEGEGMNIHYASVSPGYLDAIGTRLIAGRDFTDRDDSAAGRVLIVNQRFVDRFWPGQEGLGRIVRLGRREYAIVGVTPTGKYQSLGEDPRAFMYFPQAQEWEAGMELVVRGSQDPAVLLAAIRREVEALDPQMPIVNLQSLTSHLGTSLLPARIAGGALGLFGLIGLLLAGIGMYGVMAHSVGQRTREIGIRMALGASSGGVVRLVMGQGLRQVLLGCVLGTGGAAAAFVLIRGVLYGTGSLTAATFVAAPVVLLAVAAIAVVVPARRAARLSSVVALRRE
jgi:predicted permease